MPNAPPPLADTAAPWIDRLAPAWFRPFSRLARFDRPIGWWLLLLPCWWSAALVGAAAGAPPDPWHLVLFLVGAIVMRGAGCVFNDIIDRDIDARVERTRGRPLPSGQVGVAAAVAFMAVLALIGLAVLLQFNRLTVWLGIASLVSVAVYPFMKRVTFWPQFFLGIAFNWGALVGWSAVAGGLAPAPLLLYAGGIAWTLGYDTVYGHQDREDDALIGVKSTARRFGAATRPWLWGFYGTALALIAGAGAAAGVHWIAYAGLALAALHAARLIRRLDFDDPAQCLVFFRANRDTGLIVFAAFAAAGLAGQS
jgi:4-hydroxybenzoate polyprenyltransferase